MLAVPVRVIPLAPRARQRVLLYTDATGGGNVAWVAETPWGRFFAAATVPQRLRRWVVRRKNQARLRPSLTAWRKLWLCWQVATWELLAALVAVHHLLQGSSDLEVGTFCARRRGVVLVSGGRLCSLSTVQWHWVRCCVAHQGAWFVGSRNGRLATHVQAARLEHLD